MRERTGSPRSFTSKRLLVLLLLLLLPGSSSIWHACVCVCVRPFLRSYRLRVCIAISSHLHTTDSPPEMELLRFVW
uniref:Secreted protein n=1 Tax=Anopheles darlingi TaxID=43151 RepID=A0A2M4DGK7_ANODA